MQQRTPPRHPAFTLLELLMVMAIIAVLIGLIIIALRGVQRSAARTDSVNSIRQMLAGYIAYSGENRNYLMPGYIDYAAEESNGMYATGPLPFNVRTQYGEWLVEPHPTAYVSDHDALSSYVWRLSPYLDHTWRTMMRDYRDEAAMDYFQRQYEAAFDTSNGQVIDWDALTEIARKPSYGLNSIFLGGDNRHGGPDVTDRSPWDGWWPPVMNPDKIAAVRTTEVLNPSNVIVFTPTGEADETWSTASDGPPYKAEGEFVQPHGYAEIHPPYLIRDGDEWTERQWFFGQPPGATGNGGTSTLVPDVNFVSSGGAGLPIMRHGNEQLPVGMLDGSARVDSILEVGSDMRRWSPFEIGINPPRVQP